MESIAFEKARKFSPDVEDYDRAKLPGGLVSRPTLTYAKGSLGDGNPWVRASADVANNAHPDNSARTLAVQFASPLLYERAAAQDSVAGNYYDKLYSGTREGYDRMADFWEIPQWIGFLSHFIPDADVYVVRDMAEAKQFLGQAGYGRVAFSALDVNKGLIKELAQSYSGRFDVGGYVEKGTFADTPNVTWHDNMESIAAAAGVPYREGVDYRHFEGSDVIPRLTMSSGCLHKCAFCTVEKSLRLYPQQTIEQQADAISRLGSKLVYLNDKTFGQAGNYKSLADLNTRIKAQNPGFQGFVVQTTAAQMGKFEPEWLKRSGIKFIELGIESYNDPILKAQRKPATEALMDKATDKLRQNNIALIPNIIIGLPGETPETYARTLDWLQSNRDIISHANIYNLAVYQNTELAKQLTTASPSDFNENVLEKSFHTDPAVHQQFAGDLYGLASRMLDEHHPAGLFSPDVVDLSSVPEDQRGPGTPVTIERPDGSRYTAMSQGVVGGHHWVGRAVNTPKGPQISHGLLGPDEKVIPPGPMSPEVEERGPVWYSQLANVIDEKMPNSAPAAQVAAILRNPQNGVKAEEMKWSGLDDYLKGRGKVTKAEVQDFVRQNQVQLSEIGLPTKEEPIFDFDSDGYELVGEDEHGEPLDMVRLFRGLEFLGEFVSEQTARNIAKQDFVNRVALQPGENTKFENYQLPGGENYRELLFQLPSKEQPTPPEEIKRRAISAFYSQPVEVQRQLNIKSRRVSGGLSFDEAIQKDMIGSGDFSYSDAPFVKEWQSLWDRNQSLPDSFQSSHWDEPNVVAHARVNDRESLPYTQAQIDDIGKRLQRAVRAKSVESLGSGAPGVGVSKGIITPQEAAWFSHAKGFHNDWANKAGTRGLFIEEIQSDWHQKGRKEGYLSFSKGWSVDLVENASAERTPRYRVKDSEGNQMGVYYADSPETAIRLAQKDTNRGGGVPDAPWKTTWHEMVMRRLIRQAAEEGKDWLGWTTGEQQAERYSLANHLDRVVATPQSKNSWGIDAYDKNHKLVVSQVLLKDRLPEFVGQELADKIVAGEGEPHPEGGPAKVFEGLDLKVGGEGMKGFYDKMLVDYANKFGKKFGSRVEDRELPLQEAPSAKYPNPTIHTLPITAEMKKSVLTKGVAMFSPDTEAGKALAEKGFKFETEDFGTGMTEIRAMKDGLTAKILANQTSPTQAYLDSVVVPPDLRLHHVAETLYREMATQLQKKGVTELSGNVIHPAPMKIREKLFGLPTSVEAAGETAKGGTAYNVTSIVSPTARFSPDVERIVAAANKDEDTGKIYTGKFHGQIDDIHGAEYAGHRITEGFATTKQSFVDRKEGLKIAAKGGQVSSEFANFPGNELMADNIRGLSIPRTAFSPDSLAPDAPQSLHEATELWKPEAPESALPGLPLPERLAQQVSKQAQMEYITQAPTEPAFSPSPKEKDRLPNSVGGDLRLLHISTRPGLKKIDPKFFGGGQATSRDLSGNPKSYWFLEGSPLAQDVNIFGQGGYHAYGTTVSGNDFYDLRKGKPDTLGYYEMINRAAADDMLQDKGYKGVLVGTQDGRQVAMMFAPQKVTYAGPFSGKKAVAKNPFSPEILQPADYSTQLSEFQNEKTLKDALKKSNWAILTGTREQFGDGNSPQNVAANQQLAQELQGSGYKVVPVASKYKGIDQGASFLVSGMGPEEAKEWGTRYGQESVLTPEGLLYHDGTKVPALSKHTVVGKAAEKHDFYSTIRGGPSFSMGLDFGAKAPRDPKIYVIRHGDTDLNMDEDKVRGWIDVPLNKFGRKEAMKVSEKLKGKGISVLVASDLSRAAETAHIIGKLIGSKVVLDPGLRPWNLGELQGQKSAKIEKTMQHFTINSSIKVPGGESLDSYRERFLSTIQGLEQEYPGNIGIVTHYRGQNMLDAWAAAGRQGLQIDKDRFMDKTVGFTKPGDAMVYPRSNPSDLKPFTGKESAASPDVRQEFFTPRQMAPVGERAANVKAPEFLYPGKEATPNEATASKLARAELRYARCRSCGTVRVSLSELMVESALPRKLPPNLSPSPPRRLAAATK